MRDLKKLENELRFAADAGCDYTLLIEAAEALRDAREIIDMYANEQKVVYLKMETWTPWDHVIKLEKALNERSPDRIIVLPPYVTVMNPEELEQVKTALLGGQDADIEKEVPGGD